MIDRKALVFIESEEAKAMPFRCLHAIQNNTKVPVVVKCGGNNPLLVALGIRPWAGKEIKVLSLASNISW